MSSSQHPPIELISRGLLVWRSHILLCRNKKHAYTYLPGGHIDFAESARDALIREFHEETGLHIRTGAPLLICEHAFEQRSRPRHEWTIVFHVEHPAIEPGADPDTPPPVTSREDAIEFLWVDLASLMDIDLRPDPIRAWLLAGAQPQRDIDHTPTWLSAITTPRH